MKLESINPKNNQIINSWKTHNQSEVDSIIDNANNTYLEWRDTHLTFRLSCLEDISILLKERSKEYGVLMADEMGKPLSQGIAEVEKCAWLCDYYLQNAAEFLKPKNIDTDNFKSFITFQPKRKKSLVSRKADVDILKLTIFTEPHKKQKPPGPITGIVLPARLVRSRLN